MLRVTEQYFWPHILASWYFKTKYTWYYQRNIAGQNVALGRHIYYHSHLSPLQTLGSLTSQMPSLALPTAFLCPPGLSHPPLLLGNIFYLPCVVTFFFFSFSSLFCLKKLASSFSLVLHLLQISQCACLCAHVHVSFVCPQR